MGMNIRPWNQAFLQNFQQAMLTPEQVQALIAQQQMQNVNPNLLATNNFEGIPMTYGINYYTGEVDKNVKRPNVNASNSMELSEINPYGTEKARLYNAHLDALVNSKKMIRKINNGEI